MTGSGTSTITVNPADDLAYSTEYYVLIDATAFDDASSNSYAGISDTTALSFTTAALAGAPTALAGSLPSAGTANSPGDPGTIVLTWTAPSSDGGLAISDYIVEYSTDGTTWTTFSDGGSSTASATVTGLANSTAYTFRVSAVNAAGTGTASATANATTATVPDAPNGCCSYGPGAGLLAWTAPTSDGGDPITDYTIEYSSDDGVTWLTWVDHISATLNSSGVPFAGEPSNTYLVRVSAVNAVGTGPPITTGSFDWPGGSYVP